MAAQTNYTGTSLPTHNFFSDECSVTEDGIFNSRNSHLWAQENPNAKHMRSHQQSFAVEVWAGIINDHLIGTYLLPLRLIGDIYLTLIQGILPVLMAPRHTS
jgi:hypothetical protein